MNKRLMESLEVDNCLSFEEGMGFLAAKNYTPAAMCFEKTVNESAESVYRNRYLSYLGMAQVLGGDISGLSYCRGAADNEYYDADVYYNLALAEFRVRNRRKGFTAIQKGLSIDNSHIGLKALARRVDRRRKPPVTFLGRNNPINILVGRLSWKVQKGRLKARTYLEQIDYLLSE